jgi:hypothetical protein
MKIVGLLWVIIRWDHEFAILEDGPAAKESGLVSTDFNKADTTRTST